MWNEQRWSTLTVVTENKFVTEADSGKTGSWLFSDRARGFMIDRGPSERDHLDSTVAGVLRGGNSLSGHRRLLAVTFDVEAALPQREAWMPRRVVCLGAWWP